MPTVAAASPPSDDAPGEHDAPRLSWRDGLFLVGPDPLTSPYYSSGALILAGVGYATPAFQLGLYALLFLLAPLYIEAVLLTLSNGGTYVMTRYALSHLGKLATVAAAVVGVVISFSYVATAIVSLLSYSDYLSSLFASFERGRTAVSILASAVPSFGFGAWVMPSAWRKVGLAVGGTSLLALALSTVFPTGVVVMMAPVVMLLLLNNAGLEESVAVSRTIFLINLAVMAVTIVAGVVYLAIHGPAATHFWQGIEVPVAPGHVEGHGGGGHAGGAGGTFRLPGFATLGAALIPAALGSSILGASGVESVMNIPEELANPRRDVRRIYYWMLSILLIIGGSLSLLVFTVLPPEKLVGSAGYLLADLGATSVTGVTGSETAGHVWRIVIVANAALMLIGATNTGFAGARGLWVTMARDELLPRSLLARAANGVRTRIHWLMFAAIFALCWQGSANIEKLERWYGATFGLVMFSGIVAFILLRKFKADDRRVYEAGPNVTIGGVRLPVGAIIGLFVLTFALLGLYIQYAEEIEDLKNLLVTVMAVVVLVLLGYNHRQILRAGYQYFRRVVESVETTEIESEDRTIVVAVGGVRIGDLLRKAVALAKAQSQTTGIPYRQLVVFHMTDSVRQEVVYRVTRDALRPSGIEGNAVRIFTELTQLDPGDMKIYLALVPPVTKEPRDTLRRAVETLVDFHERHGFRGHIVMFGDYGVGDDVKRELAERLEGSTLVWAPVEGGGGDLPQPVATRRT
ncbi:MAG: amino acid permease [Deltaproteobacteria bacterium]|nr:MAG: amino acid permease [Deltaproteobacteria bacterium]